MSFDRYIPETRESLIKVVAHTSNPNYWKMSQVKFIIELKKRDAAQCWEYYYVTIDSIYIQLKQHQNEDFK